MKRAVGFLIGVTSFLLAGSVVLANDIPQPYMEDVTYYLDEETGLVRVEYHDREETAQVEIQAEDVPSKFIPVDAAEGSYRTLDELYSRFPGTRDQNPYGTCWAFSTVALAEFDMIQNHGMSSSVDYSELGLAYYSYWTAEDKLGNFNGDYRYVPADSEKGVANSGNQILAMDTLAAWKGLVSENALPYSNMNSVLNYGLDSSFVTTDQDVVLTDGYAIDIKNNPDAVKNAVKKYGAASINYYSSEDLYHNVNGYTTYYYPYDYPINHAVTIVGWDDNFSTSNFAGYIPSKPGAWLIRNSWTTYTGMSMYSYFWMSYEDQSIEEYAYVMDFVPGSTYDNNYQHDGASSECYFNVDAAANVFTAKNPDGYTSELLSAVMIKHPYAGTARTYKIRIYTGIKDSSDPTSGTLQKRAVTSVTLNNSGIFTVELEEPVPLKPGETFAVVVSSENGPTAFVYENTYDMKYTDSDGIIKPWYSTTAHADDGETFFYSGGQWYDISVSTRNGIVTVSGVGNARIKALTKNTAAKTYTISYDLNGGDNHKANPNRYCSDLGTITLKNPTREGYYFQG